MAAVARSLIADGGCASRALLSCQAIIFRIRGCLDGDGVPRYRLSCWPCLPCGPAGHTLSPSIYKPEVMRSSVNQTRLTAYTGQTVGSVGSVGRVARPAIR